LRSIRPRGESREHDSTILPANIERLSSIVHAPGKQTQNRRSDWGQLLYIRYEQPGQEMIRTRTATILYRFSVACGVGVGLCGVVFVLSPKQGIAVVMVYSLIGGFAAACASTIFALAGLIVNRLGRRQSGDD